MPEVVLCCECKQPINKTTDDYVVVKKPTDTYPEVLAHVGCEQKRATGGPRTIVARLFVDELTQLERMECGLRSSSVLETMDSTKAIEKFFPRTNRI